MTLDNLSLKKVDLHNHTPYSVCYSLAMIKPEAIVNAAITAGVDMMAITDHNSVSAVDEIRAAAGDRLTILPGIEISTQDGHFLALFDVNREVKELDEFLDYAGINPKLHGNSQYPAPDETVVTLKKIREYGGIAIASHIDRWPSGFLESKTSRRHKKEIYECEYLDALEITIPDTRNAWRNGEVRDFPMKRACTQGSDSHNPNEIGRRPIYVKMDVLGLESLKHALDNYEDHVFFPEDISYNETPQDGG